MFVIYKNELIESIKKNIEDGYSFDDEVIPYKNGISLLGSPYCLTEDSAYILVCFYAYCNIMSPIEAYRKIVIEQRKEVEKIS